MVPQVLSKSRCDGSWPTQTDGISSRCDLVFFVSLTSTWLVGSNTVLGKSRVLSARPRNDAFTKRSSVVVVVVLVLPRWTVVVCFSLQLSDHDGLCFCHRPKSDVCTATTRLVVCDRCIFVTAVWWILLVGTARCGPFHRWRILQS